MVLVESYSVFDTKSLIMKDEMRKTDFLLNSWRHPGLSVSTGIPQLTPQRVSSQNWAHTWACAPPVRAKATAMALTMLIAMLTARRMLVVGDA